MKVIFLDVDGVLNSMEFYENNNVIQNPLDRRCIYCLKEIVERTDAKIVLSSSWRGGWNIDPKKCGYQGIILNSELKYVELEIFDCTKSLTYNDGMSRSREIKKWLLECPYDIENYLILDDNDFGWEKMGLSNQWVQPNFLEKGLEEKHIELCVKILNEKNFKIKIRRLFYKFLKL